VLKTLFRHPAELSSTEMPPTGDGLTAESPSPAISKPAAEAPQFNPKVCWWKNADWLAKFDRHIQPDGFGGRFHPHRILDRRFTLTQFARTARSLRGSTAECGVFKGIGSALICETLRGTYHESERHFGFDSFEGLPETGANDGQWKRGDLADPVTTAQEHLAEFPFVQLVKGWLPATLAVARQHRFRMVHVDVDIEQATWDCLSFFYSRVVSGGLFLIDDYGFHSCPGARQATEAFLQDKPETLIELTTGQAAFFKR